MKVLFLPIDNRPVCYQLPKMISDIHKGVELLLPDIEILGDLTKTANIAGLFNWLEKNISEADVVILSLDTIAYGGLIPSRRSTDSFEDIKLRIDKLKSILQSSKAKVFAFSSVMRISNNNINEEEKEYWNLYGKQIFEYSYNYDKFGNAETSVPQSIIEDYLKTRKRNFDINKEYLAWQKSGMLETLIFSKDDCAEYGLNVAEAKELEKLGGYTKTGADEIPLTLLARAIVERIKICPVFLEPDSKNLISNYEDVSIEESVKGQISLSGCELSDYDNADVILYINNFKKHQGEIVMKIPTELYSKEWCNPDKPYIIADVRLANGADNKFIDQFLNSDMSKNFYGYSGWNTSANTLGSLICAMKFLFSSKKYGSCDWDAFYRLQFLRLLDDWGYQANVRQLLTCTDVKEIAEKMEMYEVFLNKVFKTNYDVKYSFPWNRLFEVKIEFN